ncbi:MBOAT, membrane-bound O-acyltransferase family-domain-containing protein [Helicostylum pulchrum]|nr:MBOAT, membrane-bound O-acyltransferase family-domain-containing protein [Helicostylum pulchrum]
MASMSLCHIGRQLKGFEGDTELDYSGALMIITIKLSSYGFNVIDKDAKNLTPHTQKMKIDQYPTLLQYFGWVFYFAGFLAGPSCEYAHYLNTVQSNHRPPYSAYRPALETFTKSMVFMIALIKLSPTFNYFEALKPAWSLHSFWYKMMFIQLAAILTRCKYYFIWYLSEGACILSGFGFNGTDKDGKPLFNKLSNVNVLSCEFAQSYKMLTENWNIGANHWLRHYVYLRFNPPGTASTTLKTYIISSLWHGFHPGFYLFFMISSSLQVLSRQIRRTLRPLFLGNKYVKFFYDVCTCIASMGLLNMLVPCFDLLHVPKIMHVWREIYYCHFILIAIGSVTYFALKPWLLSIQKKGDIVEKKVEKVDVVDSLSIKKAN